MEYWEHFFETYFKTCSLSCHFIGWLKGYMAVNNCLFPQTHDGHMVLNMQLIYCQIDLSFIVICLYKSMAIDTYAKGFSQNSFPHALKRQLGFEQTRINSCGFIFFIFRLYILRALSVRMNKYIECKNHFLKEGNEINYFGWVENRFKYMCIILDNKTSFKD